MCICVNVQMYFNAQHKYDTWSPGVSPLRLKPGVAAQVLLKNSAASIEYFHGTFRESVTVHVLRKHLRLHKSLLGPCTAESSS